MPPDWAATQLFCWHVSPVAQSPLPTQRTHAWVVVLQIGVAPAQLAFVEQPATQAWFTQICPPPHEASVRHATQVFAALHLGVGAAQFASVAQPGRHAPL